jgi:hypothetical protein
MTDFIEIIKGIDDKKDFLKFMELLIADLKSNPSYWENNDLESYLQAMANWTEAMEGYYRNTNQPIPKNVDWKVFANILVAATMYE